MTAYPKHQNLDALRNGIIDKLLTITDKEYLLALLQLINRGKPGTEKISLTEEQTLMLQLSEDDIKYGRLTEHGQVDKEDLEWLKGL